MPNLPISQFDQLLTTNKTPVISLNGALPLSDLRDEQYTANTGTIVDNRSEFRLHHQATGDFVRFQSQERGNYQPGFAFESGIGIRMDTTTLTGDSLAYWGYFQIDNNNPQTIQEGLVFGLDQNGVFVEVIKDSVSKEKVYTDQFNIRPNYSIDLTNGLVFQITFTYYGYGQILFQVINTDTIGSDRLRQNNINLHSVVLDNETSLDRVNLKVGALCKSSTGTVDYSLYIGGRQMSIIGIPRRRNRINSGRVESVSINNTFSPVLSLRKKSTFSQISVSFNSIKALCDTDAIIQLRLNATITGGTSPNFGDLDEQSSSETAMELDTSADTVDLSTGVKIYESFISSNTVGNSTGFSNLDIDEFGIPDDAVLTVVVRTLSGTGILDLIALVNED